MKISKDIIKLAEKIKKHRIDKKTTEELRIKKESLESQLEGLEKDIKILKLNTIEQNSLLDQINHLEKEKRQLSLDLEKVKEESTFIVTTPKEASNTVRGEISRELSKSQKEILICSPWITYIVDELSDFRKGKNIKLSLLSR